jgi:prepilin-type N-terminal cleavage/methylation domain-containing protein
MMRNNRGFTLIELLVVIAIIGILSSVVLASLNSARTKSRDARRISDIKQLQLALELYFDASSTYPSDLDDLESDYIPTVPEDPLSGDYSYVRTSATEYCLGADLEQDGHQALSSDADATCTGFDGDDEQDCTGSATDRYCYDIRD